MTDEIVKTEQHDTPQNPKRGRKPRKKREFTTTSSTPVHLYSATAEMLMALPKRERAALMTDFRRVIHAMTVAHIQRETTEVADDTPPEAVAAAG